MERVRKASPEDFPALLEQWKTAFPTDWNDLKSQPDNISTDWESRPESSLRWLFSLWLVKDPEGFLKTAKTPGSEYAGWAAEVYAKMMPEQAAGLFFGPGKNRLDRAFVMRGAWELAESHPMIYLKMDPVGEVRVVEGTMRTAHWGAAIKSLAKTDVLAAADICLNPSIDQYVLKEALESIAGVWKSDNPSMLEWLNRIEDPRIRNIASEARLLAMVEKDARAAFAEFQAIKPEQGGENSQEVATPVLVGLTQADPLKAFKLLKEIESLFSNHMGSPGQGISAADEAWGECKPFSHLAPKAGEKLENNGVRSAIMAGAEHGLPDDAGLFDFFGRLRQEMGGDSEWLRDVEVDLIRLKTRDLPGENCLTLAGLWADRLAGKPDDETFGALATRAAKMNPELVLASLDQLPESIRSFFAGEAIKRLPDAEAARNTPLLNHLTAREWDSGLGEVLGTDGAAYANVIASLPTQTTHGAWESFTKKWGDSDPDAAARWVESLPDDATAMPAARGLVNSWAEYDRDAAMSWTSTLPAGPTRDAAAASISESLAPRHSEDALRWAQSVSDPVTRHETLARLDRLWEMLAAEKASGVPDWMPPDRPRPKPVNPRIQDSSDPFASP